MAEYGRSGQSGLCFDNMAVLKLGEEEAEYAPLLSQNPKIKTAIGRRLSAVSRFFCLFDSYEMVSRRRRKRSP